MPVYIYGSREDHIVPIGGAYASTQVLPGQEALRHGRLGPHRRRDQPAGQEASAATGSREDGKLPEDASEWIAGATEHPGSWWTDWSDWLKGHAGKQIAAPKALRQRHKYKAIEPAPGRYVKAKA